MNLQPPVMPAGLLLPRGIQRPRICHVPEYVSSAGGEAVELARLAGLAADDWQAFVITGALGETAAGRWSAPTVGLTVARQNGKGGVLEIRELFGAFVLGENINHTAHQQKTATNHFERMLRLIEGVPEFDRRVLKAPKGKGNEAIVLRGGATIFFATRAGGGGRGLTFHVQVFDEAMYLTEQDRSSLAPTSAARSYENIQTWYVGSAVDQDDSTQDGVPFAQVRESGIAGQPGVAYFEFSVPGDNPESVPDEIRSDPHYWAMANPALGDRISHEWVERARTVEMGRRGFAVEILGVGDWPATDGTSNAKISAKAWAACTDTASTFDGGAVLVFDVTPNRSASAIGAAGWRSDGTPHVEVVASEPGTGWVADRLAKVCAKQSVSVILYDERSPAASLVTEITKALTAAKIDLELTPVAAKEHAEACGMLVDAVDQDDIRHLGTPELAQAVAGAATRPLGDAWAWARKSSNVNIAPLVCCTLALWGLKTSPAENNDGPLVAFV